jgi:hypothetical protein
MVRSMSLGFFEQSDPLEVGDEVDRIAAADAATTVFPHPLGAGAHERCVVRLLGERRGVVHGSDDLGRVAADKQVAVGEPLAQGAAS